MLYRFRRYGVVVGSLAAIGAAVIAGCGGTADTAKTPAVETAKMPAQESAPAPEEKKPAEAEAKTDKPATAQTKPAAPKERFALPDVDLKPADERSPVKLAGKDVTAEACLLDTSISEMQDEWFSNALRGLTAAPDGSIYVIDHEKKVRHYIPEPGDTCKLAIDKSFGDKGALKFPEDPENITVLSDGTFVVLGYDKIYKYVGGKIETGDCKVKDISPDGKTGFDRFMGEVKKVDIANECTQTDWKIKGWDPPKAEKGKEPDEWQIRSVHSFDKDFLVQMSLGGDHYLGIHSADGKLKVKMGKDRDKDKNLRDGEDICWAADAGKCAQGVCVLDSNCRRLSAWDPKKGDMIESVEVGELIGLFYPWPVALSYGPKGIAYMGVTHKGKMPENAPKDAKEISYAMIFRIKGLN